MMMASILLSSFLLAAPASPPQAAAQPPAQAVVQAAAQAAPLVAQKAASPARTAPAALHVPAGANEVFQSLFYGALDAAGRRDWARAQNLANRLPDGRLRISWDLTGVPRGQREAVESVRKDPLVAWRAMLPELRTVTSGPVHVKVSFVPNIPSTETPGLYLGATYFLSEDPADPQVEAVIALRRGPRQVEVGTGEIHSEVSHAIGLALGLTRRVTGAGVMVRQDLPSRRPRVVSRDDNQLARDLLRVSGSLRSAIAARQTLASRVPNAVIQPRSYTIGPRSEGEIIDTTVLVSNTGTAPLEFLAQPECVCMAATPSGTVPPGQELAIRVRIDTTNFPGPFNRGLMLFTNDPERPAVRIPFTGHVRAFARLIPEDPRPVVLVDERGAVLTFYLALDPAREVRILERTVSGGRAVMEIEPWQGEIADPELREPRTRRQGYRIRLLVSPSTTFGRTPITIAIRTDHPVFTWVRHTVQVQHGIVSAPESMYWGELGNQPDTAWVLVHRPGRPFRVLSVRTDRANLRATAEARGDGSEHRITVRYDGRASRGPFDGTITVLTDDPKQPEIVIPYRGLVK